MSEFSDRELELRKENAELRTQIKELSGTVRDLTTQLTLALKGNADLQEQLKDLRNKLDILLQQYKTQTRNKYGKKSETLNSDKKASESKKPKKPPKPPFFP